ncbi:FAD-dependent oxidoreductase [Streptomyces tremellae]|uniref:FAD-dependent monooxygenase n=1 Tax=Streptomyces tremellae TaxID=1124239 RepID=A0ABP7F1N6_9ACTN
MKAVPPSVLVVGAGPVGLTAAHELARHGVSVRVVDRAPGPATTSRALATHARTLEVYDQIGILDELLPRGQRVEHFTLHQNGRRLVRFDTDYSHLPTRFPYTLMVDQTITEEVLRASAARHGVTVEWGVEVETFQDLGDGVEVRLRRPDGTPEHARAEWLVGCDGGHSTVRKQLGLPLSGTSNERWLIADAHIDTPLRRDSIHWLRTRKGTIMLVPFPAPGKWRLLDTAETHYTSETALAERFSRKITDGSGLPATVHTPDWISVFTIQQRMIHRMRVGRCLLAGDAAHVHSPASGQGMNTGIQDAVNLAWRLAAVHHGASPTFLDAYSAERVPIGAALLETTGRATVMIQQRSPYIAAILRAATTVVRSVPPLKARIQRTIMGGMSALDLVYRDPAPRVSPSTTDGVGQRLARVTSQRLADSPGWQSVLTALRDPRWTLVIASPRAGSPPPWLDAHRDRLTTVTTDDAAVLHDLGLGPDGWILARPDGYVAARGSRLDAAALAALLPASDMASYRGAPS